MPWKQHYTIVAIIAVAASVFALQCIWDDAITDDYSIIPIQISQAWSSLLESGPDGNFLRTMSRLVTHAFLHGSAEHILGNMVFLWLFGALASRHVGPWVALAVFFVTALGGGITHVLLESDSAIPTLGASGAVCGFEGFYLGLALRWQLGWPDVWPLAHPVPPIQLGVFALVGFGVDAYSLANQAQGVAFGAHMGGLLTGLALAILLTSCFRSEQAFARSPFAVGRQ